MEERERWRRRCLAVVQSGSRGGGGKRTLLQKKRERTDKRKLCTLGKRWKKWGEKDPGAKRKFPLHFCMDGGGIDGL